MTDATKVGVDRFDLSTPKTFRLVLYPPGHPKIACAIQADTFDTSTTGLFRFYQRDKVSPVRIIQVGVGWSYSLSCCDEKGDIIELS